LDEIKKVVFKLKHNKVACPYGFSAEFYQLRIYQRGLEGDAG
jgi:hypothetical protein